MAARHFSFHLESEDFPVDRLALYAFEGREEIGQLFQFDLDGIVTDRAGLDLAAVVGARACLVLEEDGAEVRRFHGMIASVRDKLDPVAAHRSYRLCLVPRAHQLRLVQLQDIFQNLNVPGVVSEKLALLGLSGANMDMRLMGTYAEREFVVQYRETDLAFISRLCEHLGIAFFFDHGDDCERMVFTDHEDGYPQIGTFDFRTEGDKRDVFTLERDAQIIPATYVVHDYNYRTPTVELEAKTDIPSETARGGVIEYSPHAKTQEECQVLSLVRSEERQGTEMVYRGESDRGAFFAGGRMVLHGHPLLDEPTMLLTEVVHRGSQPVLGQGGETTQTTYRNTFRAVPSGFTYRTPRTTPWPRIDGLLTGVIEATAQGGSSELAWIDDQGRYMVRFLFHTAASAQPKTSKPVRMMQPHAGPGYGMHFPLKPGVEVLIAFMDGDPDRPLIVGTAPNPLTPSPVVAGNSKENIVRTRSGARIRLIDG